MFDVDQGCRLDRLVLPAESGSEPSTSLLDNNAREVHYSQLHERVIFQTVPEKAVSNRLDHAELEDARRPGCQQNGFQPAARDC